MANEKLTTTQEDMLVAAMLAEGVERGKAEAVITRAQQVLTGMPRSGNVTVTQTADTVEAGATVIGYQADRIG